MGDATNWALLAAGVLIGVGLAWVGLAELGGVVAAVLVAAAVNG